MGDDRGEWGGGGGRYEEGLVGGVAGGGGGGFVRGDSCPWSRPGPRFNPHPGRPLVQLADGYPLPGFPLNYLNRYPGAKQPGFGNPS